MGRRLVYGGEPEVMINTRKRLVYSLLVFLIVLLAGFAGAARATAQENAQAKLVILSGTDGSFAPLAEAHEKLMEQGYNFELKLFNSKDMGSEETVQRLKEELLDADVFLLEMLGATTAQTVEGIIDEVPDSCRVFNTRCGISFVNNPRVDSSESDYLGQYYTNGGLENFRRLQLYLASKYGQVQTAEDLTPVEMPARFAYHPGAENLSLDVAGIYRAVCEAVYGTGSGAGAGLAVDTVHRAVYDAVGQTAGDTDTALDFAVKTVHRAVYDTVEQSDPAAGFDTETLYQAVAGAVDRFEPGDGSQLLYDTVNQSVRDAVSSGGDGRLAVDTVYKALYERVDPSLTGQAFITVHQAVYDALYPQGGDPVPDLDEVYRSVHDAVYHAGGQMPGTFTSVDDYLLWYGISGKLKEGAPWIGITCYRSFFGNNDIGMHVALLRALEEKGTNVILTFTDKDRKKLVEDFFMDNGCSRIDFLIAAMGFNFIYGKPEAGVELFKQLNVPVMAPVNSNDLDDWEDSTAGISNAVYWQIAYPELDGRIEPVLMGGNRVVRFDEKTGAYLEKKVPLPDRIDRVAERALAWVNLRHKNNEKKKIALVYYNHHAGKDDIGASYLNVMESAAKILQALRDDGYRVDGDLSAEAVEELIRQRGRNIGSWAPGELEALVQAGDLITIPVEKYLEWYGTLPEKLRAQAEEEWGPPPGNIMVYDGEIVIPGVMLGNIFLGPQPVRGWGDDPGKIAHSPDLPPHHQYIAFYLWLQKEFGADAVIHLGTHGTLEWLPGRSVGLGEDDWPDALTGNMPDIYPYIVNNPGEGTQAKRRGYAVTIDHLIPPMIKPGLYGELAELQSLLGDYQQAVEDGNTTRANNLQEQIIQNVKENNLDRELGIDLDNAEFSGVAEELHEYLEELAAELMPYGLHVFGQPPQGEMLDLMIDSIIGFDPESRAGSEEQIRANLLLTTNEIDNLLRALRGEYVEPGLGRDPVRVPDAMPTGRNLVSFDSRMAPDRAAWKTGSEAADQLLDKFYAANGHYPETVGVVLWAIETMRTGGETVAMVLRLIGTEPKWDKKGRVKGVEVTPLSELGRPRINVVVTISGLFRDTFSYTVGVLDDAFRQVALLEESPEDNRVRKTYLDLRDRLVEQGLSDEEAGSLAAARIFGAAPGTYGTGVSTLAETTAAWDESQDLVDTYMNRMSYVYGKSDYGVEARTAFREILKSVDMVTQVRDSLYGVLDNDDVAQFLGGLKLAAQAASGNEVQSYIVNTRTGSPRVQTFSEFVGTELRSRVLNPKWIEGMLKEGYAGAREIGQHVANMFLVDATLEGIDDWAWQQVAETFIFDENIRSQLDPYVVQSIIGWNMEAARRGMWQADRETLNRLADTYIQTAAEYGVVCCHHTCSNLVFNEWVASYTTVDSDTLNKFKNVFAEATEKTLQIRTSTSGHSSSRKRKTQTNEQTEVTTEEQQEAAAPEQPEAAAEEQQEATAPEQQEASAGEPAVLTGDATAQQTSQAGDQPETAAPARTQAGREAREQQSEPPSSQGPAGEHAKQVASRQSGEAGSGEQVDKPARKAYEIEVEKVEKDAQPAGTGRKAVTVLAILGALAVLGVFLKGYLNRPR